MGQCSRPHNHHLATPTAISGYWYFPSRAFKYLVSMYLVTTLCRKGIISRIITGKNISTILKGEKPNKHMATNWNSWNRVNWWIFL